MDRAFQSGASASAPTPPASPSIGYPTEGNPATGTPPTKPGDYWYHMITEEIRALVVAAGLVPSQNDLSQLLQALPGALASRPEMARSLTANGYQKLPGGLILQWGLAPSVPAGNVPLLLTLPVAFPTAFLQAAVTGNGAMLIDATFGVSPSGLSQINVFNSGTSSQTVRFIALGY